MKNFLFVFVIFLVGCSTPIKFNNYSSTEQPCKWLVDENENYYELCR
jgi:hypothetical protein